MTFGEIKEGDTIYVLEVKDNIIVDAKIKEKKVEKVLPYNNTDSSEIHFTDGTMILPSCKETYAVRGIQCLLDVMKSLNLTIYACDYETCLECIKRIGTAKLRRLNDEYKTLAAQLTSICELNAMVKTIDEKKRSKSLVTVEPVYVD